MNDHNISLDLMEFVETNILPRYNAFDKAHNISHAVRVLMPIWRIPLPLITTWGWKVREPSTT